jgi:putative signal transducing protein
MAENNELVTIGRFSTLPEMDMARGLLESEGIDCLAPEEHLVAATGGIYGQAVGWLRLQVRPQDAERATALLESLPAVDANPEEEED